MKELQKKDITLESNLKVFDVNRKTTDIFETQSITIIILLCVISFLSKCKYPSFHLYYFTTALDVWDSAGYEITKKCNWTDQSLYFIVLLNKTIRLFVTHTWIGGMTISQITWLHYEFYITYCNKYILNPTICPCVSLK